MTEHPIWNPETGITDLEADPAQLSASQIPGIKAVLTDQRKRLKGSAQLSDFTGRLSREWAIETGVIENLYSIAAWLWRADRDGSLSAFLKPDFPPAERSVAQVEGWILGVPGLVRSGEGRDASVTPNACAPNVFRLR